MKKGEFLKDKAQRFFRNAIELFNREEYDLSAFNLEQSAQLFLKFALWKKLGDFEKVHSIFKLLSDLKEVSDNKDKIEEFFKKHEETIGDLEIAYIESRYLPVQFYRNQVEKMIRLVEDLEKLIERE